MTVNIYHINTSNMYVSFIHTHVYVVLLCLGIQANSVFLRPKP